MVAGLRGQCPYMRISLIVFLLALSTTSQADMKPQVVMPTEPVDTQNASASSPTPAPTTKAAGAPDASAQQTPAAQPGKQQSAMPPQMQPPNLQGSNNSPLGNFLSDPTAFSPEPALNTNWDSYEYPDNHVFGYGGYGLKNIGNGLCVAKNKNRSHAKYCSILAELLDDPNTCAGNTARQIIAMAGSTGSGIGDFGRYCSSFGRLPSQRDKLMVIQQVLSSLIVKESGWNPSAQEKPWVKSGRVMGGKGLFQIGVNDRGQDPDCAALDTNSIFDPKTNMKCGACIALKNIVRDRTMGHGTGDSGARGMARYFGPFRDLQADKKASIQNAVNQYCTARANGGAQAEAYAAIAPGISGTKTQTADAGGVTPGAR